MALLIGLIIIAGVAAIAIAALLTVRRRAPDGGFFNDSDRAAGVFGVLATGFAVLLGFIVFLAFASYDESRVGAITEAQLVAQQYATAQRLPEPTGPQLAAELICYGRFVVHREWEAMQEGDLADEPNPWGLATFQTLAGVNVQTPLEQSALDQWLEQESERQIARVDRVQGADGIIPWPLWVVLIASAVVILGYMLFFADSGERALVQAVQIGAVMAVITGMLLLIRVLEDPHGSGLDTLEPTAMEETLDLIEVRLQGATIHAELPCDESGERLAQ
jgi:hypothetical protein